MPNSADAAAPTAPAHTSRLVALGMLAWAVASLRWWLRAWPFTIDDAYISARYAQHWAAGNGLVYNIGERVEGFSNFTWVCLLTLLEAAHVPLELGVKVLGLTAAAATALGMLCLLTRRLGVTAVPLVLAAAVWLGLDPGFAVWALGGLETPLFAALLVWALYLWLDEAPGTTAHALGLGCVLALLAWTRPEGPAVAVGLGILTPLFYREARSRRVRLAACGGALVVVALGFCLRRWYYEAWWPNPYYVKLGGGFEQIREGFGYWIAAVGRRGGPALLVWMATAVVIRVPEVSVRRAQWVLLLTWLGYSAFIIRSGREPFPFHRFYVPLVPLAISAGAPGAQHWGRRQIEHAVGIGAVAALCMFMSVSLFRGHWQQVAQLTEITRSISLPFGRWVRAHPEFPSTLGVFWAGAMPYAAGPDIRAVDMGGLCDRHIARVPLPWAERNHGHTRHDFAYVLDQRPTYVTDDALHTLDTLVALGGPRHAMHETQRAQFLAEYTRLNDDLFIRVQPDTLARMEQFTADFPDDAAARDALAAYRSRAQ